MCLQCVCRVSSEMAQFRDGLGQLGDLVRRCPETLQSLFVSHSNKLTLVALKRLYTVLWSAPGSNRRNEEEKTIFMFEMFLADCDSEC